MGLPIPPSLTYTQPPRTQIKKKAVIAEISRKAKAARARARAASRTPSPVRIVPSGMRSSAPWSPQLVKVAYPAPLSPKSPVQLARAGSPRALSPVPALRPASPSGVSY